MTIEYWINIQSDNMSYEHMMCMFFVFGVLLFFFVFISGERESILRASDGEFRAIIGLLSAQQSFALVNQ